MQIPQVSWKHARTPLRGNISWPEPEMFCSPSYSSCCPIFTCSLRMLRRFTSKTTTVLKKPVTFSNVLKMYFNTDQLQILQISSASLYSSTEHWGGGGEGCLGGWVGGGTSMTGLLTYSKFMHAFLTKVVLDNPKARPRFARHSNS